MDEDIIGQNEIEEMLNAAGGGGGASKPAAANPPAPKSPEVLPEEIDALLSTAASKAASATSAPAAAATAAAQTGSTAANAGPATADRNVGDDVQLLLDQAEEALASAGQPLADVESTGATRYQFKDLAGTPLSEEKATIDLLRDVELDLKIELGRTDMLLEDVLKLRKGSVVALDKLAGDPVDVYVNGRLIARGEVLVLNDNFCVRVAELISGDDN